MTQAATPITQPVTSISQTSITRDEIESRSEQNVGDGHVEPPKAKKGLQIKITGYRLFCTILPVVLGVIKAALTYVGYSTAPTTLDMLVGVFVGVAMVWLGFYETIKPPVAEWFFHKDYYASGLFTELGYLAFSLTSFFGVFAFTLLIYSLTILKLGNYIATWEESQRALPLTLSCVVLYFFVDIVQTFWIFGSMEMLDAIQAHFAKRWDRSNRPLFAWFFDFNFQMLIRETQRKKWLRGCFSAFLLTCVLIVVVSIKLKEGFTESSFSSSHGPLLFSIATSIVDTSVSPFVFGLLVIFSRPFFAWVWPANEQSSK